MIGGHETEAVLRGTHSTWDTLPVQGDRDENAGPALQASRRQVDGADLGRGPPRTRRRPVRATPEPKATSWCLFVRVATRAPTTSRASPATRSFSACTAPSGRAPTKPNAPSSPTRSRCGRIRSCRTSTAGSGSSSRRCGRTSQGWGRRRCRCSGKWRRRVIDIEQALEMARDRNVQVGRDSGIDLRDASA